jgi:hypothetical protein
MGEFILAAHARPSLPDREWRMGGGEWIKATIRYSPLRSSHPLFATFPLPSFRKDGVGGAHKRKGRLDIPFVERFRPKEVEIDRNPMTDDALSRHFLGEGVGRICTNVRQGSRAALESPRLFKDGDLPSIPKSDQNIPRAARDRVSEIPDVPITYGSLAVALGDCKA